MSLDTSDSRIGLRCPSYLKQYVEDKARLTGCSSGEILRRMMFMDMIMNYSPEGVRKLRGLKDTYEASGGIMPSSMIESMLGKPWEPQDRPIEEALRMGLKSIAVDPITINTVKELVRPIPKDEPVEQDVRQEVEQLVKPIVEQEVKQDIGQNVEQSVEPSDEQSVLQSVEQDVEQIEQAHKQSKKPKRPKMGATNFMI